VEAWEGKELGGIRVPLANPRCERRFLRFLELSGVGRVMANGTDEDDVVMGEWIVWGDHAWGANLITFSFLSLYSL
jgi:hypothetical protein